MYFQFVKKYRLLSLFLFLLFSNTLVAQETIVITNQDNLQTLADKIQILVDANNELTIEDILKEENQQKFIPNPLGGLYAQASESTMWIKFVVENQSDGDVWVDWSNAHPVELDVFTLGRQGKTVNILKSGIRRPKENRPAYSNHYIFSLSEYAKSQTQVFYIKSTALFPITYQSRIGVESEIVPQARKYEIRYSLYLGLMLVMILYNLFIGYSTKDRVYLYYILYLIYIAFIIPYQLGDYLFFHDIEFNEFVPVLGLFGYLIPTLFAYRYLNMKKNAYWFYVIIGVLTILLISISVFYLFGIFSYTSYLNNIALLSLLYNPILWAVGVYLWIKGHKNARFYTIAWTTALGVSLLNFMVILGILPYGEYLTNIFYLGFSLEVILFGMALGDKMNMLQLEKQAAQDENIRLVEGQKETLEKKVTERTLELQEANEELQVTNEELSQSQEELAAQRDFLDQKNEQLSFHQSQINNSINAAKSIQQAILPYQEKLDALLKNYFIIYRPKDVVSGDFYWLNQIDNKVVLVVADCTGHGVPGAFMTLIANNLLDKIIHLKKNTNPAEVLTILHEEVQHVLRQKETRNNNGLDAVVLTIEKKGEDSEVVFAGAKSDIWYFSPNSNEITVLSGTRKSIGGQQSEAKKFENQTIQLPSNSIFYAGSDGLIDQNNSIRKRFGKKKLKQFTIDNHHLELEEQKEKLELELENYMKDTLQRDDILWMGVRL